MKKLEKKQLKFEKEVITSLSENELYSVKGGQGGGTITVLSVCCVESRTVCNTKNGCSIITLSQKPCQSVDITCIPEQPSTPDHCQKA